MSKILFENKKVALGFAGAIIVGAMIFSGVSGSDRGSDRAQSRLAQGELSAGAGRQNASSDADDEGKAKEDEIAFAEDEELIDSTSGFDPSPDGDDDDSRDEEEEEEEQEEEEDPEDRFRPYGDLDDSEDEEAPTFNGSF